jgi:hypothetical protein
VRRPGFREAAGAALFYSAAAVLFTWPLAARMRSGMPDLWDDKLNAWIFHWDFHQVFRDPLRLFDANIFHPARHTLAFSENLFGAAVFGFPLYAAGASTLLTANVLMLLGMALSGIAAWALAREVTGDSAASLLAGIVYAFVPWRIAQLPHVQFQWGPFLALLLLFLLRALDGDSDADSGRRRDAALFGLFFAWNAVTNVHYALFSALLVALVAAHAALTLDRSVFLRRARPVALAGAVACLAALPFYVPYIRAAREYGMVRGEGEIETYSGRPVDFLTAGSQNKLYAPLTQKWSHAEGDFFPGLAVVVLAAAGWSLLRRRAGSPSRAERVSAGRRRAARILDLLAGAGLLAALAASLLHRQTLGPIKVRDPGRIVAVVSALLLVRLVLAFPDRSRFASLADFVRRARSGSRAILFAWIAGLGALVALGVHTPVYRFLVQSFGSVFRSIRVPGRGIVLFDLALGVLAAWGLSLATANRSARTRRFAVAAALAAVAFEYRAFPIEIGRVAEASAPVYRWVGGLALPAGNSVVEWPLGFDTDVEYVFRSTAHWKPLVNGYSGFAPPHYNRLHDLLEQPAIPDAVWDAMRRLDAAVLLFHPTAVREDAIRRYVAALEKGLRDGRISPIASFTRGDPDADADRDLPDLAFRLAGAGLDPTRIPIEPGHALASTEEVLAILDRVVSRRTAPFGVVDHPVENAEVSAGEWSFGWAVDDSGIARVTVSADGVEPIACVIHAPYPGVEAVYPGFPEAKRPGFGCPVPQLPPGPRVLVYELAANDGGSTVLRRPVKMRP